MWSDSKVAISKKRCIIRDIVHYVFLHKLSISSEKFIYIADQAESVLENPFVSIHINICVQLFNLLI